MEHYLNGETVTEEKIEATEKMVTSDVANEKNYDKALRIYSGMLVEDPGNPLLYRHRGHRYLSIERYEEAAADISIATKLEPNYWKNWNYMGMINYYLGNYERALTYYDKALEVAGMNSLVSSAMINWEYLCLKHLGRDDDAMKVLKSFPADLEKSLFAYKDLILMNRGLLTRSEVEKKYNDNDSNVYRSTYEYGIAMSYYYEGNVAKAKEILMDMRAKKKDIWFTLGYIAADCELDRIK